MEDERLVTSQKELCCHGIGSLCKTLQKKRDVSETNKNLLKRTKVVIFQKRL
jgi:hypothetical protein